MILFVLGFICGGGVALGFCDREVRQAKELAEQERRSAQIAREALRRLMEGRPCVPPPSC